MDSYGVIKTNRTIISENVNIPADTNGFSTGPITIQSGYDVTVDGEWVIL